jgi:hypothetical protein
MLHRCERETADFAKIGRDNPGGSTKIATWAIAASRVAARSEADAVGSMSLDNVAVWVNEGDASVEVIR